MLAPIAAGRGQTRSFRHPERAPSAAAVLTYLAWTIGELHRSSFTSSRGTQAAAGR
jgi:hypothetical protein